MCTAGTLLSLYRRAMQLEAAFFSAQPHQPPGRSVSLLMVDFDETCSQRDSIGGLMRLSAQAHAKVHRDVQYTVTCSTAVHEGMYAAQCAHAELVRCKGAQAGVDSFSMA